MFLLSLLVLAEWFFASFLLAALVAGLYRLQKKNKAQTSFVAGYYVSISDPDAEMQLSYAIDLFNKGAFEDATDYAYKATQKLLKSVSDKMGFDIGEGSLDTLAIKLQEYGLSGFDISSIKYLVEIKNSNPKVFTEDTARKSIQLARALMLYMRHAPINIKQDDIFDHGADKVPRI